MYGRGKDRPNARGLRGLRRGQSHSQDWSSREAIESPSWASSNVPATSSANQGWGTSASTPQTGTGGGWGGAGGGWGEASASGNGWGEASASGNGWGGNDGWGTTGNPAANGWENKDAGKGSQKPALGEVVSGDRPQKPTPAAPETRTVDTATGTAKRPTVSLPEKPPDAEPPKNETTGKVRHPERPSSAVANRETRSATLDVKSALSERLPMAVRLQLRLERLQRESEQAKIVQSSPQNGHIGATARGILESTRKDLEADVSRAKRDLLAAVEKLVELPENPKPSMHDYLPARDDAELIAYVDQLKIWIMDVRTHLCHRIKRNAQSQPAPEHPPEPAEKVGPNTSSAADGPEIGQQTHIEQITARLDALELRLDETFEASEEVIRTSVSLESIENGIEATPSAIDPLTLQAQDVALRASALDGKINEDIQRIATLMLGGQDRSAQMEELNMLRDELRMKRQQLSADLMVVSEQHALIAAQAQDIEQLLISIDVDSRNSQVAADIDEIAVHLENTVEQILEEDVRPHLTQLLHDLNIEIDRLNKGIYQSTWTRLKPALTLIREVGDTLSANLQ